MDFSWWAWQVQVKPLGSEPVQTYCAVKEALWRWDELGLAGYKASMRAREMSLLPLAKMLSFLASVLENLSVCLVEKTVASPRSLFSECALLHSSCRGWRGPLGSWSPTLLLKQVLCSRLHFPVNKSLGCAPGSWAVSGLSIVSAEWVINYWCFPLLQSVYQVTWMQACQHHMRSGWLHLWQHVPTCIRSPDPGTSLSLNQRCVSQVIRKLAALFVGTCFWLCDREDATGRWAEPA